MPEYIIICEIKKKRLVISTLEEQTGEIKVIGSQNYPGKEFTKTQIKNFLTSYLASNRLPKRIRSRVIVGCFAFEPETVKALDLKYDSKIFNNCIRDLPNDFLIFEKHELISLNDFPYKSLELNKGDTKNGTNGLIISIGNHLQCFEELILNNRKSKEVIKIQFGELFFSPLNDFDYNFGKFMQNNNKHVTQYSEIINKTGLKMIYLYIAKTSNVQIPKEPSFKDLLVLITEKNVEAIAAVEYFFKLMGYFLFSSILLTLPNKQVVFTGSFLVKIVAAFSDNDRLRKIFMDNLVLAQHLDHKIKNLKISIQTDIDELVRKSTFENA